MTKQIREKLNKFLIENSDDKELIQFFKDLIKKNPKEFGFPSPNVDGLSSLVHGKLKSQAKLLLSKPKQKRLKSVMRLLYENQLSSFFDTPIITQQGLDKRKELKLERIKLINLDYDNLPDRDTRIESYFKQSRVFIEEWEKNPSELQKNLIKLRNKVR